MYTSDGQLAKLVKIAHKMSIREYTNWLNYKLLKKEKRIKNENSENC